ncbi:MAG: asparagine synthase-related protein [Desulfobacterales bacterium]|nr:asparagine synthase-related protein [Desulfobacterales bacterium]
MASIAGIISKHGKIDFNSTKQLGRMLKLMRHRGPDNSVIRTLMDDRGALGANEINLTPKTTYTTSMSEAPYILFDGELFNDRADEQCDVELFKEYYEKHERDCFKYLNGSFSCAIVEKDEEVILARDHVGARPLFFGSDNGVFYFSSEMKGLKDHIQFDVQELPPGCIYSSKKGMKNFEPFQPQLPEIGDIEQTAKTLRNLLIDAVKIRMDGVGAVSLSGGLDSSIIAVIAKEFNPHIKLVTGAVEKAPGPDLENAKLMAKYLDLEHHIYMITEDDIKNYISDAVWHLESFDEDCISGIISNFYVSRKVKEFTNLVFVGEGADELFGGYRMVLKNPKVKSDEQRERLAQKLLEIAYNTALRRLDRAWMANAVVYQTPFLDTRVVAFSRKIPMQWKIYGEKQIEKYILREAFRDMLPEKIANREKLRFAMGTGMDDVMDDIISEIINPDEIKHRPKAAYGLPFASFKELYYYDEFLQQFPPSYEKQTIRWDPFK